MNQPTIPKETNSLPAPTNGATTGAKPPTALPFDLTSLSNGVIALLALEVPREFERRKAKALEEIEETARTLCTTPERLIAAAQRAKREPAPPNPHDRRHVVRPLLWNPKDHTQRWSKRGAAPKWYVDHIAAGGSEADCAIPEGAL